MATSWSCSGYILILEGMLVMVNCAFTIGMYIALVFRHKHYFFVSKHEIRSAGSYQVWYGSHVQISIRQFE